MTVAVASPDPSVRSLVAGIVTDVEMLFRQEFRLARQELREDLRGARHVAAELVVAVLLLALGGAVVVLVAGATLAWVYGWPNFAGYGLAGVFLALVGGLLLARGQRDVRHVDLVPEKTVRTLEENVEWLKHRTRSART